MFVVLHSPIIRHCKGLVFLEIGENIDKDCYMAIIFTIVLSKAKESIEIFMRTRLCKQMKCYFMLLA